jgi:hypothetical protein
LGDEGSPEGDQVGVSLGNRLLCRLLGVSAVAHEWAVEHLSELGQGHRLYPLADLPTALTVATHIDPLAYGIDGLRGAFTGQSHFDVGTDLAVLGAVACCFLALGAWLFSRIQV